MLAQLEIDPKNFLRQHCTLPALPEVVGQVQTLMSDDSADIGEVADLISSDPALLAQVLKVVNSAYYGLPKEITKARFAIAFLGYNEVYRMVLSLSVINTLSIREKDELTAFWHHSFYTAITARHLANRYLPHLSREDLWSAAMLHDIGKLIYVKYFPDHYGVIRKHREENLCLFSESERELDQPSSSWIGSLLCDHWGLPEKIREACEHHTLDALGPADDGGEPNSEWEGERDDFRKTIVMGNNLTLLAGSELRPETKESIITATMSAFDLEEGEFLALVGEVQDLRNEADRFMSQLR